MMRFNCPKITQVVCAVLLLPGLPTGAQTQSPPSNSDSQNIQRPTDPAAEAAAPPSAACTFPWESVRRNAGNMAGLSKDPEFMEYLHCKNPGASIPTAADYLRHRNDQFSVISASQDGQSFLLSRRDVNYVWQLPSREFVRSLSGPGVTMKMAADGKRGLYSDAQTGKVSVFDFATGQTTQTPVTLLSPDELVGLVGENHTGSPSNKPLINVYDSVTGPRSKWRGGLPKSEGQAPLALSQHGDTLVTLQYYRRIKFGQLAENLINLGIAAWSLNISGLPSFATNPTLVGVPIAPLDTVATALYLPGSVAQSTRDLTDADKRLVIWELNQQRRIMTLNAPDTLCPTCLALNVAGNVMMIENEDRSIDAIDLPSGKRRRLVKPAPPKVLTEFADNPSFDTLQISPDGGKVLRIASTGAMTIFDSSSGSAAATIPKDSDPADPTNLVRSWFSPDSRFLAVFTGYPDASLLRIWDAATGKLLLSRRQTNGVFTSEGSVVLDDDIGAEVPVLHSLVTGTEEKFEEIPSSALVLLSPRAFEQ